MLAKPRNYFIHNSEVLFELGVYFDAISYTDNRKDKEFLSFLDHLSSEFKAFGTNQSTNRVPHITTLGEKICEEIPKSSKREDTNHQKSAFKSFSSTSNSIPEVDANEDEKLETFSQEKDSNCNLEENFTQDPATELVIKFLR
jgi:hypothetical protein